MPDDDVAPDLIAGEVVSEAYDGPGDWLSPAEAARRLGVSERTLWRRVNAGQYQKRVQAGKAQFLVPLAGSAPNEAGLALPAAPDADLTLAIIEELRRRDQDAQERLTRQAEEIGSLKAQLAEAREQAARDALAARRRFRWWPW